MKFLNSSYNKYSSVCTLASGCLSPVVCTAASGLKGSARVVTVCIAPKVVWEPVLFVPVPSVLDTSSGKSI